MFYHAVSRVKACNGSSDLTERSVSGALLAALNTRGRSKHKDKAQQAAAALGASHYDGATAAADFNLMARGGAHRDTTECRLAWISLFLSLRALAFFLEQQQRRACVPWLNFQ